MGRHKRSNAVRKSGISQAKKQSIDSSNDVNQNNHGISEECARFGVDTRENLMVSTLNHQSTVGKRKRSIAVRKNGKPQAEKQLIDSSNEVRQNNHCINENYAQFGGVDTRENVMVSSLNHQNSLGERIRLKVVQKGGKSQAQKQLIDSSNEVNPNNHSINEEFVQFGEDTSEKHQNILAKLKTFLRNSGESLTEKQLIDILRNSGESLAEKQLIDIPNEVNRNSQGIHEDCASFGGVDTRENVRVSSVINHQHTIGKRKRLAVKKSGKSLVEKQLVESTNEVNQNNHGINRECAPFGRVGTTENVMASSVINHQNTTRKSKRLSVQKSGKSLAEKQLNQGTNEVNQNNHTINEERAQFGGDTHGNVMVSSVINHQITMGKHTRLNVQKRGKSLAEKQLVESTNEVNQNNHSRDEERVQFGGVDTRENALVSSAINHQNTMGKRKSLNVQKSRRSLAEKQWIENTNEVNQNNHSRNEERVQFGGDTRENAMVSSAINQQNTMGKRKSLNVQKSCRSLAEKQWIEITNEVNQNNHSRNEEHVQFGGDTRENVMVSSLNHQNDQSRSEQESEGSDVEPQIYFGRMSKKIGKGQKRVRGYTVMSDVWCIPDGEFIRVEVDPLGNPIGFEGKKLLNAMGCLVRKHQYAPINYLSWKDMPEIYVTKMLELIQSKFQFVPKLTEQTKQILKDNLSSKWRQFKHDLKAKGYDESKTEEEMATNIPDTRVDPSQYRDLVHHWCSMKGQKISNINKKNRSKYEDIHCMGTKNLPRFIHETREANGVQPSRAEIYIGTRTRKDGSIVTPKAANVIGELKKHMVGIPSSENPQTIQDSTNWENDIFAKVKGPERRGSVRCLGKIPSHVNSSASPNVSPNVEIKLHKLENLLGNLVSVLQTRFSEDQQINDVLRAIAQEVPNTSSLPNDSTSNNQQTTSGGN